MADQFKISPHLEVVEADDEWIVLNASNYTITKLNKSGGQILSLLKNPASLRGMVDHLRDQYANVDQHTESEISAFLQELLEIGLVEPVNS
ncbi:PqqD family protein [Alicyclobacillus fastidiosus]|uniref:PqqD family protein n=1 Tax=Alicyclobacillus fastidiosus TaxID=392011 RepID=A0ABV5AAL4_9BACL|nr:PqqD family protein [Alicyclobacillus fastidiosus]WEH07612.1 PqqD family protein [Alicyclobacillus fastidiosus]